jgi:pimeloyl-ACP methyl ester carboxylesterase
LIGTAAVLFATAAILLKFLFAPNGEAAEALMSDDRVRVAKESGWLSFKPAAASLPAASVILYPGAFAVPECYAALARRLAAEGHPVYVVKMPLNLAFLGTSRAERVMAAHPGEAFVIGGHSIGGMAAGRYAVRHARSVKGVFFLASHGEPHPELRRARLPVLHITATDDGLMKWGMLQVSKRDKSADTDYVSVDGGNHTQFGSFRAYAADGRASITETRQQEIIAKAMDRWLDKINLAKAE